MNGNDSGSNPNPMQQLNRVLNWLVTELSSRPLLLFAGFALAALLSLAPTMFYTVDRDEQGVLMQFGSYQHTVQPGLHYKFPPPIQTVRIVNTERVFSESFGYRPREGQDGTNLERSGYLEESLILTGDLGVARVGWEIHYRRENPRNVVFNIKNEQSVLRDAAQATVRRVIGDWNATDVMTRARQDIRLDAREQLQSIMDQYQSGIQIDDVELQFTEPPEPVLPAFQEVDSARQAREQLRLEAERERERIIPETRGEVEERLGRTRGQVAEIVNEARGDAERFNEILQSYEAAPEVTRTRLYLDAMNNVLQNSERVFIVDPAVPGVLPHMQLDDFEIDGAGEGNSP